MKLHIVGADGSRRDRIPACIRRAVQDPTTHDYCGQIWNPPKPYVWKHEFDPASINAPLIYEAHVGMAGEEPRVHTYREFADSVLPRVAKAGYNTVQLMAVQEHPYYGSFGYHVSSFFAPCSRFGTPEDLKYLIDTAHGLGLAVLLDVVHSHAVKNMAEGLNDFDGSGHQYFHDGPRGDHPAWDSKCFDYGRPEVRQFLLSNVRYWLEEFRFDGFRFDGVTSMLYSLARRRSPSAATTTTSAATPTRTPILYLQLATKLIQELKPGAIAIAEDMSGMPGLCRPIADGGARLHLPPRDGHPRLLDQAAQAQPRRGLGHGRALGHPRQPPPRRGHHRLRRKPRPGARRRQDARLLADGQGDVLAHGQGRSDIRSSSAASPCTS